MALTRATDKIIANADGNLNLSGIVTAANFVGGGAGLTGLNVDASALKSGSDIKAQANPHGVVVTGVLTATSYTGDGSNLTNLPAGLGTALSSDQTSPLNKLYYTNEVLSIASTITVDHPATGTGAYTQYADLRLEEDADLIIEDGDDVIPNILGLGTDGGGLGAGGSGRVRVDSITNKNANGAPNFPNGLTGTAATIAGIVTLTSGGVDTVGVVTASSFDGSLNASQITSGTVADARISASSVTQHVTSFSDDKITNDISKLALKVNALENATASNTNSTFVDTYQDSAGISTITSARRDLSGEFIVSSSDAWNSSTQYKEGQLLFDVFAPAQNSGYSGYQPGTLIIDGNLSNDYGVIFMGGPGTGFNIGYQYKFGSDPDFGANTKIHAIRQYNFRQNGRCKDYVIETTNDGTNWTRQAITGSENSSAVSSTVLRMANSDSWNTATLDTPFVGISTLSSVRMMFEGHYNAGNDNAGLSEFQLYAGTYAPTISATGNYQSVVVNAPATTSKIGVVVTYIDQAGTATLNTDLKLFLSANNGTNFTQATLVAEPNFATGVKCAKANDVTISNTGTQLKYKVEFANQSGSKETRITGVSLQY